MGQDLGTFDFKQLNVILGVSEISGFAEGEAVEINEENDAFESQAGADGYVDRVRNRSNFLTITLRLAQTSPTNQVLSALHMADRLGGVTLPLLIKDGSGDSLVTAVAAWIVGYPKNISFGNNVSAREWVIKTGSTYIINLAGNA